MRCKSVQEEIATETMQINLLTRWRIARHLAHCSECRNFADSLKELETVVAEWHTDSPPLSLQNKIADSLRQANFASSSSVPISRAEPSRIFSTRSRIMKRTLSLAAVLTIAAIFALNLVGNPVSAAAAVRRMQEAITRVQTAHVTTLTKEYKTDNDTVLHRFTTLQKVEEEWFTDGKWRKEGVWGTRIIKNGHYYRRDPKTGDIPNVTESGKQRSTVFNLDELLGGNINTANAKSSVIATTVQNGHTVNTYLIKHDENHQTLCQIDTVTNLPIRIELQSRQNDTWTTDTQEDFEFNQSLEDSLFDPQKLP